MQNTKAIPAAAHTVAARAGVLLTGALLLGVVLVGVPLLSSCRREPPPEQAAPVTIPPPPVVTDAPGAYVLRYFSATSGELTSVRSPADVPEGARAQVIVSPEDPNLAGPWLFVADLTKKQGDRFEVHGIDRTALEAKIAKAAPASAPAAKPVAAAPAADGDVVIFRTSWCGYCKKAAEYLKLKGVPFVEKDLEQDPGAREDMLARAQKAGVPQSRLQGVPILSVHGKIITGFDRAGIDAALQH